MWSANRGLRRQASRSQPRPLILMYHRIAVPRVDPWGLAVHPDRFERHLETLCRSRCVLPLSDLACKLAQGTLPANAVALTFDDGYADNLHTAKPRLEAAGVPATLFLLTGTVGEQSEYWWDELARLILLHRGTADHDITVAGEPFRLRLVASESRRSLWRGYRRPGRQRESIYSSLWHRLRDRSADERACVLRQLRELLDPPPADPADFPLTGQEVDALATGGVFQIGSHTVSHAVLPSLTAAELRRELRESQLACERLARRRIDGFAYPHGEHDAASRAAVRECGFSWACSTRGRPLAHPQVDLFAMPRLTIRDWDGPAFEQALRAAGLP